MDKDNRCEISNVGKTRNGKPRWWCTKHEAPATGRYGTRLKECESAHLDQDNLKKLDLDPRVFPGGIGIWGAVEPVFDTSGRNDSPGVHVHARSEVGGEKDIDDTFDAVIMIAQTDLFRSLPISITQQAAVAFYISQFLNFEMKHIFCVKCGALHLDLGYFATHPHKKHLCHSCGKYFLDSEKGISNPIMYFRTLSDTFQSNRNLKKSDRPLEISQSDYPGGLKIWASNPALIWTAERHEEEGIHIHAYKDSTGAPVLDETFGYVSIDGLELNYRQVAQLMAQKTLDHLRKKVISIRCPACNLPHFDDGVDGVTPHKNHECHRCGETFQNPGQRKLVVSNPIIDILDALEKSSPNFKD